MNMSWKTRLASLAVTAGLALGLAAQPAAAQDDERRYLLATAGTGGTYYPVGVAIATLVAVKLENAHGISMSAITSAGSGENIKLLRDDESQFAILQGLYGVYAWKGIGPLADEGPQQGLRAVTMLWPNVEHFLIDADLAKTGTVADMAEAKGKAAGFGKQNSGSLGSARTLLGNLGIDVDADYALFYAGYGALADGLQDGKLAAIGTPAGVPVGTVTKAFAAAGGRIRLLGFTPAQADRADGGNQLWEPYPIPAGTYPDQTEAITTIAQPNFLAVRADVPDEDVYRITKTVYENLPFLHSIHKATEAMSLQKAMTGLPMPLHPGAQRYYEEAGLQIPDRLKAP